MNRFRQCRAVQLTSLDSPEIFLLHNPTGVENNPTGVRLNPTGAKNNPTDVMTWFASILKVVF